MGAIKVRVCPQAHEYEVLVHNGAVSVLEHGDDVENLTCPKCGSAEFTETLGSSRQRPHGAGYPYNDIGLGCRIESAQHRRQVMRELGLVSADGEMERETDRALADMDAKRAKVEAERRDTRARQGADQGVRQVQHRLSQARTPQDMLRAVYGEAADEMFAHITSPRE